MRPLANLNECSFTAPISTSPFPLAWPFVTGSACVSTLIVADGQDLSVKESQVGILPDPRRRHRARGLPRTSPSDLRHRRTHPAAPQTFCTTTTVCLGPSVRHESISGVSYGVYMTFTAMRTYSSLLNFHRKTPWKLSPTRKANARARLKKVDSVIEAVRASGVECGALVSS